MYEFESSKRHRDVVPIHSNRVARRRVRLSSLGGYVCYRFFSLRLMNTESNSARAPLRCSAAVRVRLIATHRSPIVLDINPCRIRLEF